MMIVRQFEIKNIAVSKDKAESPLIVHTNRMPSVSVTGKLMKAIAERYGMNAINR